MHSISIFIDIGSTHSYVTLKVVKRCGLRKKRHDKPWLVLQATNKKRNVSEVVKECTIELNVFPIVAELNTLPLGSYNALIRMDWMKHH